MHFFITEQERKEIGYTCFFEFQKGNPSYYEDSNISWPKCWQEDSLCIDEDVFYDTGFIKYFPVLFDCYDINIVTKEQWEQIVSSIPSDDMKAQQVLEDLQQWVEDNFAEYDYFTIIGI